MALNNNASIKEVMDTFEQINSKIIDRGGARTITPSTSNQVLSKGNYKGDVTILGDSDFKKENIRSGINLFGLNGSLIEGVPDGKRWATGKVSGNSTVEVAVNFGFTPKYIMVYPDPPVNEPDSYLNAFALYFGENIHLCLNSQGVSGVPVSQNGGYVRSTGFRLTIAVSSGGARNLKWIVFE